MDIAWFEDLRKEDVGIAGGKGANLGEMTNAKLPIPPGFVITAEVYTRFLDESGLRQKVNAVLEKTDVDNTKELQNSSKKIRKMMMSVKMPASVKKVANENYKKLCKSAGKKKVFVAVRSSATAEDLPGASFAGQQETFLNISGTDLIDSVQKCWSSLFTPRAIFYREKQGFEHDKVSMAVVIQMMVDSETAGVVFTSNPMTGDNSQLIIEAGWGLGEGVVSGTVTPDHYVMDKAKLKLIEKEIGKKEIMFTKDRKTGKTVKVKLKGKKRTEQVLNEGEMKKITKFCIDIEKHYGSPQDIEWAIKNNKVFLVQSRPITTFYGEEKKEEAAKEAKEDQEILIKGLGASPGIGSGKVAMLFNIEELDKVQEGDVLVTTMTNPDMVPAMKRASAIVTEEGGMTCHAAIVSRELGIPSVVGTGNATDVLKDGMEITIDGSRGVVYRGLTKQAEKPDEAAVVAPQKLITATEVKVNLAVPDERIAAKVAALADGVGLLRVEHIILGMGRHPMDFIGKGAEEEFIDRLASDIKIVVDAFYKTNGIVYIRTLDAPTDEFRGMKGGEDEPLEHNPMLGWRGIRRGVDQPELLRSEFKAIKRLVDEGYTNIGVMIPLVQHPGELAEAKRLAREVGLVPHKDVQFGIMVETPASALIVEDFIEEGLDFISFGTNDLTQYTLALDRNNERIQKLFSEKHPAVLKLIEMVIKKCRAAGVDTSICGQAGSYPEVVKILVELGISSVSANPDAIQTVRETVFRTEKRLLLDRARE
ncbi:MAG: phosphoenolpyruvate synthase [Candidatus Hydrothermarchaeaceae archaeon]